MASIKPSYEEVPEFNVIAKKLVDKLGQLFPGVDSQIYTDNIKCVAINNKEIDSTDEIFHKIEGIGNPLRMFCEIGYIVVINLQQWQELSEARKNKFVLQMLKRIPTDTEPDGKVLPLDFKDDGCLVRSLGPDYLLDETIDPLKDTIEWIIK